MNEINTEPIQSRIPFSIEIAAGTALTAVHPMLFTAVLALFILRSQVLTSPSPLSTFPGI